MPSPGFLEVARSEELEEGKGRPFRLEGIHLALVRHAGVVYALEDRCPHANAPIALGPIENGCIACPWHYAEFDLRTGTVLSGPACESIPAFPVEEEDGRIFVSLTPLEREPS